LKLTQKIILTCHCLRFTQFEFVFFRYKTGYVTVYTLCAVHYLIIICFSLLFYNYLTYVFNILFVCFCLVFLFSILCILCFCIVSLFVLSLSYLYTVYWPLPPGGNPIAVNVYHIIYHTISYHISYHIIKDELTGSKYNPN